MNTSGYTTFDAMKNPDITGQTVYEWNTASGFWSNTTMTVEDVTSNIATTNKIIVKGSVEASTAGTVDLGQTGCRFKNGYFSGSVYVASGVYESSDERLKDFGNDIEVDLDKLAQLPKKYFNWKNSNDNTQIGTSAQELEKLYPELVTVTEDGYLNVAYDKLSIIALAGIDKLNEKINSLESRLEKLEKLIN